LQWHDQYLASLNHTGSSDHNNEFWLEKEQLIDVRINQTLKVAGGLATGFHRMRSRQP